MPVEDDVYSADFSFMCVSVTSGCGSIYLLDSFNENSRSTHEARVKPKYSRHYIIFNDGKLENECICIISVIMNL